MKLEYKKLATIFLLVLLTAATFPSMNMTVPVHAPPAVQFTCEVFDRGLDTDGNGLYDYLVVDVEIQVMDAGWYLVRGDGLCDDEGYVDVSDEEGEYFVPGSYNVSLMLNGGILSVSEKNVTKISSIYIYDESHNQLDDKHDVPLSRQYNYTEFDAPFTDLDVRLIVYPDGRVKVEGTVNATDMPESFPSDLAEYVEIIVTEFEDGFWWSNGSFTFNIPEMGSEYGYISPDLFPFNSTYLSYYEYLSEGINYGDMNFTMLLPPEYMEFLPPEYKEILPLNETDLELMGTFDGYDLDGSIHLTLTANLTNLLTTLLEFPFGFNETVELPLHLLLNYDKGEYNGTLTVYLVEGLPIKFLDVDIDGDLSGICFTGSVDIIFGEYGPPIPPELGNITYEWLNQMVTGLTTTLNETIYSETMGVMECPTVDITLTNITDGSEVIGATVSFEVCIQEVETYTGAALFIFLFPMMDQVGLSPEVGMWLLSAVNDTLYKIQDTTIELIYAPSTTTTEFWLNGTIHLRDIFDQLFEPITPPEWWPDDWPELPPEINRTVLPCNGSFVDMLNATICSFEDASIHMSYSGEEGRIDLNATYTLNYDAMMQDMIELIPDLRECLEPLLEPEMEYYESIFYDPIMELLNGTYVNITWYEVSMSYADGVFEQSGDSLLEGDLNAAVNRLYHTMWDVVNETGGPPLPESLLEFLNATDLDLSDFYIDMAIEGNSIAGDVRMAAIVPIDPINETSFQLNTLFSLFCDVPIPDRWSEFSLRAVGGGNVTHGVLVVWPGGEPIPDAVDPSGYFVAWENVSLCDIANLTFTLFVNTPPTVSAITIPTRTLKPGEDITGSVTASDDESYVNVTVSFKGPDGWHNITALPEEGAFTFSTSTEGWAEGEYTVYITATDAHGATTTYQDPEKVTVKTPFPWMLVLGAVGAVAVLLIAFFLLRRR